MNTRRCSIILFLNPEKFGNKIFKISPDNCLLFFLVCVCVGMCAYLCPFLLVYKHVGVPYHACGHWRTTSSVGLTLQFETGSFVLFLSNIPQTICSSCCLEFSCLCLQSCCRSSKNTSRFTWELRIEDQVFHGSTISSFSHGTISRAQKFDLGAQRFR